MHLLDANVLITAHNLYYPIGRFPEFWDWLVHMGNIGEIKIPVEILEEIAEGSEIGLWLRDGDNYDQLRLNEDVDPAAVQVVLARYAPDLNDAEIIQIGRDPFLIAYALLQPANRIVVTVEASKPASQRANRRIPDICRDINVQWCNSFEMMATLNFTTAWRAQI